MHTNSIPPTDRDELAVIALAGDALRAEVSRVITQSSVTNAAIGRAIGYDGATVGLWRNNKYTGAVTEIELRLREWLLTRRIATVTGVPTIESEVSKFVSKRVEECRENRLFEIIIGEAGIGKSRALGLYLMSHRLAIGFRTRCFRKGARGIADDLRTAAGITRLGKGERIWDAIVDRTQDSGRVLIVDDAHELSQSGLQACVDWHDDTRNPLMLIGLPSLLKKLMGDDRRSRRNGGVHTLKVADYKPLVSHLVTSLAPYINGERDELVALSVEVAKHAGGFGAVEQQLRFAARVVSKINCTWVKAFRTAHERLPRNYTLN